METRKNDIRNLIISILLVILIILILFLIFGNLLPSKKGNSNNNVTIDFKLNGNSEITLDLGSNYVDPGYSAIGSDGIDYSDKVIISGSVNTNIEGKYIITYTLNNPPSKSLTRVVTVVNNNKPIVIKKDDEAMINTKTVDYKEDVTYEADVTMSSKLTPTIEYYGDDTCSIRKTPSSVGTYYIIVKTKGNNEYNPYTSGCTKAIIIKEVININLSIASNYYKVNKGETITINASVTPANTKITWTSSNDNIATVDSNGVVIGVSDGAVTITAMAGDKKASTSVIVLASKEIKTYTSSTLAYWIEEPNSLYKITHIWVSDPYNQIKVAFSTLTSGAQKNGQEYPRNLMYPKDIIANEIKTKNLQNKGLVAYNATPAVSNDFNSELKSEGYLGLPAIPLVLDDGKILVNYSNKTNLISYHNNTTNKTEKITVASRVAANYVYTINKNGNLGYYKFKSVKDESDTENLNYNEERTNTIINSGAKYTGVPQTVVLFIFPCM